MIGLLNSKGDLVAQYIYDAWGKPISIQDGDGKDVSGDPSHIANRNPLRYRGYYYDQETGFYYLQSRYYDPVLCRFINADTFASTGQDFLGYNMFAYCNNNPINLRDSCGKLPVTMNNVLMTDSMMLGGGPKRDDYLGSSNNKESDFYHEEIASVQSGVTCFSGSKMPCGVGVSGTGYSATFGKKGKVQVTPYSFLNSSARFGFGKSFFGADAGVSLLSSSVSFSLFGFNISVTGEVFSLGIGAGIDLEKKTFTGRFSALFGVSWSVSWGG